MFEFPTDDALDTGSSPGLRIRKVGGHQDLYTTGGASSGDTAVGFGTGGSEDVPTYDRTKVTPELSAKAHQHSVAFAEQLAFPDTDAGRHSRAATVSYQYHKFIADALANKSTQPVASSTPSAVAQQLVAAAATNSAVFDLGLPNLTAQPSKPLCPVTFELGQMGRQRTKYHWVLEEPRFLVLVFDTRFEYAEPYIPPVLGQERSLHLLVHGEVEEVFEVYSLGIELQFGVFHMTLLVRKRADDAGVGSDID